MRVLSAARCPLCFQPATIIDWRPTSAWLTVDDCTCGGYFAEAVLVDKRFPGLAQGERDELSARVLGIRFIHLEAWITSADGTVDGPLTVLIEKPSRPR
jgi:hypothetical protein